MVVLRLTVVPLIRLMMISISSELGKRRKSSTLKSVTLKVAVSPSTRKSVETMPVSSAPGTTGGKGGGGGELGGRGSGDGGG